ncbi:MAG TPA: glycosyltransferase [Patescibacteria group bacterium]|nr:glycosyltransferase [Patescibacteria group bacterium]
MSEQPRQLRVAIVHDWLIGGGAERVVYELHKMYPDAPIYTSYCTDEWHQRLNGKVVTGYLQKWPFSKLRKFVGVLRIWWFSGLDFSGYDLVISSSGNGEAFGVKTPTGTTHVCYCHTPTHYYWRQYDQYMKHPGFGILDPLARLGLRILAGPLRRWDYKAAQRVDYFIANSSHIQADIKKYYGRDSVVMHPPVDISRFAVAKAKPRHGFLTVGRQVPAKHTDIIVKACSQLNLPLNVIGSGPEHDKLAQMAGPTIKFPENVSDSALADYFASAETFLFASYDDFGITPVEAMAAGTPVIAFKAGGALDYVEDGKTGTFFGQQTSESLGKAIKSFDSKKFSHQTIRTSSQKFSSENFQKQFQNFIGRIFA